MTTPSFHSASADRMHRYHRIGLSLRGRRLAVGRSPVPDHDAGVRLPEPAFGPAAKLARAATRAAAKRIEFLLSAFSCNFILVPSFTVFCRQLMIPTSYCTRWFKTRKDPRDQAQSATRPDARRRKRKNVLGVLPDGQRDRTTKRNFGVEPSGG